jgi:tRNA(Arg) A34 adenosine deaminase TadA
MNDHTPFIRHAYALAAEAVAAGNHPFGALLVRDGEVLLTAQNLVNSATDVTAHAELTLVRHATQQLGLDLSGTTLYTSTEPCLMCCGAIYWAHIDRVVYGVAARSLAAITGGHFVIASAEIFSRLTPHIDVVGPVLEEEGLPLHQTYWPARSI